MRRSLLAFLKDESGGFAIEHALIATAIAISTITVVHAAFYRQ
jgi:Flp pilus assembly pilin Flp